MTREDKLTQIEELTTVLNDTPTIYLADIAALDADTTSSLRKSKFWKRNQANGRKEYVAQKSYGCIRERLRRSLRCIKGNTSIMLSEAGNAPAKLIKEFRKKNDKPVLKGAWIEEAFT